MNWKAELGEVHEVRDEEGSRICIMTQLRGRHGMGGRIDGNESAARARLIAASPELLEALKKAKEFISNGIEFGFIRMPDGGDPAHETLPIILHAIKKAEGK